MKCSHTPNVTMDTAFFDAPFTFGEECVVRVRASLQDDGCTWTMSSKISSLLVYTDTCVCVCVCVCVVLCCVVCMFCVV